MLHDVLPVELLPKLRGRGLDLPVTGFEDEAERFFDYDARTLAATRHIDGIERALLNLEDLDQSTPLKAQIAGPCTLLASMRDAWQQPLWHVEAIRDAVSLYLAALAAESARRVHAAHPLAALFLDEPMLGHLENSGEADGALRTLAPAIEAIRGAGLAVGLHVCSTPPFAIIDRLELDFCSLDLVRYGREIEAEGRRLAGLSRRGTRLVLGVVPVLGDERTPPPCDLLRSFLGALPAADQDAVSERLLLSPSCGTLLAPPDREEAIALALRCAAEELSQ